GVPRLRLRFRSADDRGADLDLVGGEDVALLAVEVVQKRDVGAAVRVVLDRRHLGRHAFLLATPEIDDAVAPLVAAAAEARGDAPPVVASAALLARAKQGLLGTGTGDLGEVRRGHRPTGGRVWTVLLGRHCPSLLRRGRRAARCAARP